MNQLELIQQTRAAAVIVLDDLQNSINAETDLESLDKWFEALIPKITPEQGLFLQGILKELNREVLDRIKIPADIAQNFIDELDAITPVDTDPDHDGD